MTYSPLIHHNDIPVTDSYKIVFHNGCRVRNDYPCQLPDGVVADNIAPTKHDGNGFYVSIPSGVQLSKPIQIINVLDAHQDASIKNRHLVMMETGSHAEIFVGYYSISGEEIQAEDTTEVRLGEAAHLELVRIQKTNALSRLSTKTVVNQSASSRMKTQYITLGGKNVSNSLKVELSGTKAEHTAAGLSLTKQSEYLNNEIQIVHASPDCQSTQLFKYILSDYSIGDYTGRIIVEKDAQKTIAYQRNNNILLHPAAKINFRPQLEIYADDVKCSHGATVGQLDAEALFYLRSRGVAEHEAKKILLQAFAHEVLDTVSCASIRENILRLTDQYLMAV